MTDREDTKRQRRAVSATRRLLVAALVLGLVTLLLGVAACGGDDAATTPVGDDAGALTDPVTDDEPADPIEPPLPPSPSPSANDGGSAASAPPPAPAGGGAASLQIDPDGDSLKSGSRGTRVEQLQRALVSLGLNPGNADGVFGGKTEAVVQRFQRQNGLTDDGVAGPMTIRAINNALAASIG